MQGTADALREWADNLEGWEPDVEYEDCDPDDHDQEDCELEEAGEHLPEDWFGSLDLSVLDDLPGYGG